MVRHFLLVASTAWALARAGKLTSEMGVPGRKWRLPDGQGEVSARAELLSWLGLDEAALVDSPERGSPESVLVASEMYTSERDWLDKLAVKAGFTKQPSPARALRVLIRAAIANRDFFPIRVDVEGPLPPWLANLQPSNKHQRLRRWLDALPKEAIDELLTEVQSAVRRRKK